ncbi:MAG: hypothetical protein R2722_04170 [Tessaracoccus sp.]
MESSPTLGGEQLRVGVIAGVVGLGTWRSTPSSTTEVFGIVVTGSSRRRGGDDIRGDGAAGEAVGLALSLPAVAGAIVGIAVTADSFVIFFERIRDEIRDGRSLTSSIVPGWQKARGTIVVSDAVLPLRPPWCSSSRRLRRGWRSRSPSD